MPNIIPHAPNPFRIEERHTTATGVERTVSVEPVGHNREQAVRLFDARVAANLPAYTPTSGIRIVLTGGDR
ncbi:hypothetical protein AB0875_12455 [Micromonospora gifhornensis]|uniref:hypothetical protein n=1 Tax=Micromonospora gifhornensis TaxID=84594 RepID=UPI003451325C